MHIVVVASGDLPASHIEHAQDHVDKADRIIAADGGLAHCRTMGLWPQLLVGDLDSAPREIVDAARLRGVEVREHPTDKDATDLELALHEALAAGAREVTVVAAFGGRLDHELATISLLASDLLRHVRVAAFDGRRRLDVVRDTVELAGIVGTNVSLVPWGGDVGGVTTAGLRWPLRNETLRFGGTRGVSNETVAERQMVSVTTGVLLVIADEGGAVDPPIGAPRSSRIDDAEPPVADLDEAKGRLEGLG